MCARNTNDGNEICSRGGRCVFGCGRKRQSLDLIAVQGEKRMHLDTVTHGNDRSPHKEAIILSNYFQLVQKPSSDRFTHGNDLSVHKKAIVRLIRKQ